MSRIHDMGGRLGEAAVRPDDDAVFTKDWHARALAVTLASGFLGQWNIDAARKSRESLLPADYMRFSYYEIWLAGLADLLVARGILSAEELATGQGEGISPLAGRCLKAEKVDRALAAGGATLREGNSSGIFAVGDKVRTPRRPGNKVHFQGHTRLPSYACGVVGQIVRSHGAHVFPDSNAHFDGEAPEPLYAVAFDAQSLWGDEAENPDDTVILDLWQSYLEPA